MQCINNYRFYFHRHLATYSTLARRQQSTIQSFRRSKPHGCLLLILDLDGHKKRRRAVALSRSLSPRRLVPKRGVGFLRSYPNSPNSEHTSMKLEVPTGSSSPRTAYRGACVPSEHDRIPATCNLATEHKCINIAVIALFSESAHYF